MELVIMAAGMGSRFGGLKQLEPIDDNGNFIIDYSIYDAIRCGFTKVIFIIKEENYEAFRDTVGKRVENKIETVYVFQNNKNVPNNYSIPNERVKPLGTGHAILCTKNEVNSPFAVINADDFYGYSAFKAASEFLTNNTDENKYALVGYKAKNTFCNSGSVKRGVCYSKDDYLTEIVESSLNKNEDGTITATPIDGIHKDSFDIDPDTTVSMNLFAFTPKFMSYLDEHFIEFLETNKNNLASAEFFLPSVVTTLIKSGKSKVEVINSDAVWYGMTYKEDKEVVKSSIQAEINNGIYPSSLWS